MRHTNCVRIGVLSALALSTFTISNDAEGIPVCNPGPAIASAETKQYAIKPYRCDPSVRNPLGAAASWESAVVGGVAAFVADRAQQEVVQWFVDTMLADFCDDIVAKDLFKTVCELRSQFRNAALPSRTSILAALRGDLEYTPGKLLAMADKESGEAWATVLLHLFIGLRAGQGPLAMLAGLADVPAFAGAPSCKEGQRKPTCALLLTGIVVKAYEEMISGGVVDSASDLGKILQGKLTAAGITGSDWAKFGWSPIYAYVHELDVRLQDLAERTKKKGSSSPSREELTDLGYSISLVVLEAISSLSGELIPKEEIRLDYMDSAGKAIAAVMSGKYAEALLPMGRLLEKIKLSGGSASPALTRYLPLTIDLLSAKSDTDVRTVLEAAATPVGGWRLKRASSLVSIGALAGVSAGWELGLRDDLLRQQGFVLSVFAPVGVDFSWPVSDENNSTQGFFVSVLDVGNLVGVRVGGTEEKGVKEVDSQPQIGLAQVLSPGVYARFGIGRSPFVLALGASWCPKLRRALLQTDEEVEINAVRFQLSLAADVMILPF
jgi:hypothetical protein